MQNITAYTAPGAEYPEFISVNLKHGGVSITVRSPANKDGVGTYPGEVSEIVVPFDVFKRMAQEITAFLEKRVVEVSSQ